MSDIKKTTKKLVLTTALTLAITAGSALESSKAQAANEIEKCYGVVKAGHNDCANASGTHSCQGNAVVDGGKGEWIALPKGICKRLVNGSTEPGQD